MKLFFVGDYVNDFNLEKSYLRAAEHLKYEVNFFSFKESERQEGFKKYITKITNFFSINISQSGKVNRKFVIDVLNKKPDVVFVFCTVNVSTASLMFLKSVLDLKIVLIWPDTLINITSNLYSSIKHFDLCASYSKTAISQFKTAGASNVSWIPLAADLDLHKLEIQEKENYLYDISFVGNWRPEREYIIEKLISQFPNLKIRVFGISWKKNLANKSIAKYCSNELLTGKLMSAIFQQSKINLNIIDPTNFPAANMRFFEVLAAGGLQLSSECPEFEDEFIDGESMFFYKNDLELFNKVKLILAKSSILKIRKKGQENVINNHIYIKRLQEILKKI